MTHGKNGKTNSMEKEFTEYTEALALKELGFDEPCFAVYIDKTLIIEDDWLYSTNQNTFISSNFTAPLYQQAFRWFREKYGLFVAPNVISYEGDPYLWFFEINSITHPLGTDLVETDDYKTYVISIPHAIPI